MERLLEGFYKSKKWLKIRKYVLWRDRWTCHDCGELIFSYPIVHHIVPLTPQNISDADITLNINNLMTLCGQCHNKRHDRYEAFRLMRLVSTKETVFDSDLNLDYSKRGTYENAIYEK